MKLIPGEEYGIITTGIGNSEITVVSVVIRGIQFDPDHPCLDDYPAIRQEAKTAAELANARKREHWRRLGRDN